MTFDELDRALRDALETGNIGTPVACRLHFQLSGSEYDRYALLARATQTVEACCPLTAVQLRAQQNAQGGQLQVWLQNPAGQTVLITLGTGAAQRSMLQLLVIGNHGVIRLEGGEAWWPGRIGEPAGLSRWQGPVEQSLATGQAVAVDR